MNSSYTMLEGIRLGIDEMDSQHQILLEIAEHFRCSQNNYSQTCQAELGTILRALLEYARYHLKAEELYLQQIGYPELSDHKRQHHKLVANLNQNIALFNQHQLTQQDLSNFIENWITRHIMEEDAKYGEFVHALA